jgi:hypothetical protein
VEERALAASPFVGRKVKLIDCSQGVGRLRGGFGFWGMERVVCWCLSRLEVAILAKYGERMVLRLWVRIL